MRPCSGTEPAEAVLQVEGSQVFEAVGRCVDVRVVPICWMWERLAQEAVALRDAPLAFVLLGDDTVVEPAGWSETVLGANSFVLVVLRHVFELSTMPRPSSVHGYGRCRGRAPGSNML